MLESRKVNRTLQETPRNFIILNLSYTSFALIHWMTDEDAVFCLLSVHGAWGKQFDRVVNFAFESPVREMQCKIQNCMQESCSPFIVFIIDV